MKITNYNKSALVKAIREVGVNADDIIFSHVGVGMLGFPEEADTVDAISQLIIDAFQEVLGPGGTLLIPTYTYSFCRQKIFNPHVTPSEIGPFTEYFRNLPDVKRSVEPIFSVAGLGPKAGELFQDLPHDCFGADSLYAKLIKVNAKICNIGVGFQYATFVHHVEQMMKAPNRFLKLFTGTIEGDGETRKEGWLYNVRILADNCSADFSRMEKKAKGEGICRTAQVGRGEVTCTGCPDLDKMVRRELAADPWFLAKGPPGNTIDLEKQRVGGKIFSVKLPEHASIKQMINTLWKLPRDIISDGYDTALEALAKQVPMTIHEYPSGSLCWTWVVPEKWTCAEAYLETLGGKRLFSYEENPLHVVSYSMPFEGEVSREELFKHLYVHDRFPEAIPFKFKYYDRDRGLCCSRQLKESLKDERYRVVIKTDFSYGTLKVGEVIVPGRSEESIILCAHLCHPTMVNDDLVGVVAGIDIMRRLLLRSGLHYTYRLLILPETIGSIAHLSHQEDLIPKIKGGLFLATLGTRHPHALKLSFSGDTYLDRIFSRVMKESDKESWAIPFNSLGGGDDERQFNAPGVRIPLLHLSRLLPPGTPDWPFREYHTNFDTPENISIPLLEASRDLVLKMIDAVEEDVVPVNKFKGEIFCSRYGLHVDFYTDKEGNAQLLNVMYLIDGTRSVKDIADTCGISVNKVQDILDEFYRHDLIKYA